MAERKTRTRRREKKNVPVGLAYIQSTFNNITITLTDPNGNVLSWASSGTVGFKGSRKSTPYAAGQAAEEAPAGRWITVCARWTCVSRAPAAVGRPPSVPFRPLA